MAHIRKPLAAAAALNTLICVAELWASSRAHSLSLLMDAIHNCSDELGLLCLFLAHAVAQRASRAFQQTANFFNGMGLVIISGVVSWQSVERLVHPRPVIGWLPVAVGVLGVLDNWGVTSLLRPWAFLEGR